jgi:hypothetical protein
MREFEAGAHEARRQWDWRGSCSVGEPSMHELLPMMLIAIVSLALTDGAARLDSGELPFGD